MTERGSMGNVDESTNRIVTFLNVRLSADRSLMCIERSAMTIIDLILSTGNAKIMHFPVPFSSPFQICPTQLHGAAQVKVSSRLLVMCAAKNESLLVCFPQI